MCLKVSDREVIIQGQMLNDCIVNATQSILKKQFPLINGFQNTLIGQRGQLFDAISNFSSIQILHTGNVVVLVCTSYKSVIKKQVWKIILCIILGDSHWICVEIINKCEVLVMDSLSSSLDLNDHTLIQIASLLKSERPSISIQKISTQQQSGFLDCGLFAIAYSLEACLGTTRTVKQKFDQKKMRQHLINCLEINLLAPFPKTKGNVLCSLEERMKLNVYCVCRLPDIYDKEMILCDVCSKWFHKRCVAVIDAHLEWMCPNCHK